MGLQNWCNKALTCTVVIICCTSAVAKTVSKQLKKCCNVDVPATLRVMFVIGIPSAVVPLHWTTIPFSLTVAVNVRVEVMSATVPPGTVVRLVRLVREATKSKSAQFTAETLLHSNLLPMGLVLRNWIRALSGRNGSTIQSKTAPCLTVHV